MTEQWVPDCHDSGCRYAKTRGGMRTQGGKCRCMERAMDVIEAADRLAEAIKDYGVRRTLSSGEAVGEALAAYRKVRG